MQLNIRLPSEPRPSLFPSRPSPPHPHPHPPIRGQQVGLHVWVAAPLCFLIAAERRSLAADGRPDCPHAANQAPAQSMGVDKCVGEDSRPGNTCSQQEACTARVCE